MDDRSLEIRTTGGVATLWLNRPQVRNALDEVLISDITRAVAELQADESVRVLVLAGRGSAFCAGADLHWMRRAASYSEEQNLHEARRFAEMLRSVHDSAKPVIARVHGAAYAGGMGLAAACDVIVADPAAVFCLSEVRVGLVPATISPYIIRALGEHAARRYMLSAERISAPEAWRLGFVHELAAEGALDQAVTRLAAALHAGGPQALARTKALIGHIAGRPVDDAMVEETAAVIASVRSSPEGREGLSCFLEKRKPGW